MAEPPQVWSRGFTWMSAHDGPGIGLYYLNQDDSDFYGTFSFDNVSGERNVAHKVRIDGTQDRYRHFWPRVRYEARRDDKAPWESLGESSPRGRSKSLVVRPRQSNVDLWVILNIFKPLIGKYESGRIVLSSGERSEFQLKYLAPPEP